jgi:uncharacterized protein with gpF-like domain
MSKRLINGSPQTEQRRQERLLILMERRFGRLLAAEVARASRVMLQQYEATGAAPSLQDNHARNVADIYRQMTLMAVEVFGERIVSQGKSRGLLLETKSFAEFFARLASEYVNGEAIRQRITNVAETTRNSIISQIRRGQDEGLGTRAIAKLINSNVGGISRMRGALIARTETHGAANYGADGAARATGLKLRKEWVAAEDERTRESHRLAADSGPVGMDQAFNVDGEQLMYPGDPSASAGNVINCRCAVSHIVDD